MTGSIDILLKLIRLAIGTETDYSLPVDIDWSEVVDLSFSQNVDAISVDGYHKWLDNAVDGVPECQLETDEALEDIKFEWFGSVLQAEADCEQHLNIVKELSGIFVSGAMPFMIMKGLSCGRYYPNPSHRSCGDIDIYFGEKYKASNELLKKSGIGVEESYYRHSVSTIDDVMIENHCVLCDTRGPKSTKMLERQLEELAERCLSGERGSYLNNQHIEGLVLPSADFNALFLPWHVSAHFAFEKVTIRHLLDWALFIWKDGKNIDEKMFLTAQEKYTFGFSKISKVLTALAIDKLYIPVDSLPDFLGYVVK